jgi:hypothetical protein
MVPEAKAIADFMMEVYMHVTGAIHLVETLLTKNLLNILAILYVAIKNR